MSRRPTRADLARHYSLEWLQEREDAQTEPCPDCSAPAGTTCRNPITGRPLDRSPAHPGRIRARSRTSRTGASSRRSTVVATSRRSSPTRRRAA